MLSGVGVTDLEITEDKQYIYTKWVGIIKRCYSKGNSDKSPTYVGCLVCEDWKYFSSFYTWCKDYEKRTGICCKDYALDKDLLSKGVKIYSPETCCFLTKAINTFLTIKRRNNTSGFIGVSYQKYTKLHKAEINDPLLKKRVCIGYFKTAQEAQISYNNYKIELATKLENLGFLDYDSNLKGALIVSIKNLLK